MPEILYTLQWSVRKIINRKPRWFVEYEPVLVNVNDAVAEFLADDDKRERRYQWKIKKQKQDANIHTVISLDEVGTTIFNTRLLDLCDGALNKKRRGFIRTLVSDMFTIDKKNLSPLPETDFEVCALRNRPRNMWKVS